MHLKMSSAKWRPFCLGLNVLMQWTQHLKPNLPVRVHIHSCGVYQHARRCYCISDPQTMSTDNLDPMLRQLIHDICLTLCSLNEQITWLRMIIKIIRGCRTCQISTYWGLVTRIEQIRDISSIQRSEQSWASELSTTRRSYMFVQNFWTGL